MTTLKDKIDMSRIPQHVAVIMDGNGRWAKLHGKERLFGHYNGVESVRAVITASVQLGVKYLTLYTFSTENWNRPKAEVDGLMELLVENIVKETPTFHEKNIRFTTIGNNSLLPEKALRKLEECIAETASNSGMTLVLALSYSSRWEITDAVRRIADKVKNGELNVEDIDDDVVSNNLTTAGIPDPELLIRTSGELRLSNYLLWQMAYTELYFTDTLWPDFREESFYEAIVDYQKRERRFGKTSEQLERELL
ncbi:MAG: isoprenyl transferase [Paludibacteraceae bacterium]|nr:isoprenyl transferase [Paludibacteraceae bacterium]MBR5238136.1 isoprenyl transferase [Paludibacteraceae bacterium]MBR5824568.1 isoprenyl transferase [Paludibacteraceae bacterium]